MRMNAGMQDRGGVDAWGHRKPIGDIAFAARRCRKIDRYDQHLATDGSGSFDQIVLDLGILGAVELKLEISAGDVCDFLP